jgi:hypothetical protein
MHPRLPFAFVLLAPVLLLQAATTARADEPSSELTALAQKIAAEQEKLFRKKAELKVLQLEKECFPEEPKAPVGKDPAHPRSNGLLDAAKKELLRDPAKRQDALHTLRTQQQENATRALQQLRAALEAEARVAEKWAEQETRLGINLGQSETWGVRDELALHVNLAGVAINVTLWMVLVAVLAAGFALFTVRRSWRRLYRSHRGGAIFVALLPALAGIGLLLVLVRLGGANPHAGTAAGPQRLKSEVADRRKELGELKDQVDNPSELDQALVATREFVQKQRGLALRAWEKLLTPPNPAQGELAGRFRQDEDAAYNLLHKALVESQVARLAAAEGTKVLERANKRKERLEQAVDRERGDALLRSGIRLGVGVGLLLLALVPPYLIRRGPRHQLEEAAKRCPCCAQEDTLAPENIPGPNNRPLPYMRCICGYEFPASYRELPRLCLPTVGVPSSGKTHWLLTVYDRIKNQKVPVPASFTQEASMADEEFARLAKLLFGRQHERAPATQYGLGWPLLFHARDLGSFGGDAAMINVFDFSGELMKRSIYKDHLRAQALAMDGFVLFLDPTQVDELSMYELRLEDQLEALDRFKKELREVRGLKVGARLDVPVAVCLSKLDLITVRNQIQTQAKPWLRELRTTLRDRSYVTLEMLHRRSEMCEDALPSLFPGTDIRGILRSAFGNHFLFFPISVIGLEESVLGQDELHHTDPFGVVEPVLWLLHMHGYRIFE